MEYLLDKVDEPDEKRFFEGSLLRFLRNQLRTKPRIIDDEGLKERFNNLQKLLESVENLSSLVNWDKKKSSFEKDLDRKKKARIEARRHAKKLGKDSAAIDVSYIDQPGQVAQNRSQGLSVGDLGRKGIMKAHSSPNASLLCVNKPFKRLQLSQINPTGGANADFEGLLDNNGKS